MVANYLEKHFKISINGRLVPINYLGYEIREDVAWCYQEVKNVKKIGKITVLNNLLFEFNSAQTNLVELKNKWGIKNS